MSQDGCTVIQHKLVRDVPASYWCVGLLQRVDVSTALMHASCLPKMSPWHNADSWFTLPWLFNGSVHQHCVLHNSGVC
jgi:hypothetical protein